MRSAVESQVKNIFEKFGIDIKYTHNRDDNPEMYMNCLIGAISVKKPFNIVQIGANDGKYNDPIYEFVKEYKDHTNIILVEPIKTLIPYLREHYSYHPSSEIINKGIAAPESSSLELYGVDQDYWDNIDAGYGEEWPKYRVPTGVTTTNKDLLLKWVTKNVKTDANPEDVIKKFDVDMTRPDYIISKSKIMNDVQLLQVDTEGMDDQVVYSFLEDNILPNFINIERTHLNKVRQNKYDQILRDSGYCICDYSSREKLAIKQFSSK